MMNSKFSDLTDKCLVNSKFSDLNDKMNIPSAHVPICKLCHTLTFSKF